MKALKLTGSTAAMFLTMFLLCNLSLADAHGGSDVKLVLQITVDGLRGDLLDRYQAGFDVA
jgi:hypothetical protein